MNFLTVTQILTVYTDLKNKVIDLEHSLKAIRGVNWKDGVQLDTRQSVQILYSALTRCRDELQAFEECKFTADSSVMQYFTKGAEFEI